jgi:hypothetical protein
MDDELERPWHNLKFIQSLFSGGIEESEEVFQSG